MYNAQKESEKEKLDGNGIWDSVTGLFRESGRDNQASDSYFCTRQKMAVQKQYGEKLNYGKMEDHFTFCYCPFVGRVLMAEIELKQKEKVERCSSHCGFAN